MLPTLLLVLIGIVGAAIVLSLLGTLYFRIKRGPLNKEDGDVEMVGNQMTVPIISPEVNFAASSPRVGAVAEPKEAHWSRRPGVWAK
jgi:hypothetical protein